MKKVSGWRIALEWTNPYTEPPNGKRVLAEKFIITDKGGCKYPEEWKDLHTLGDGYGFACAHISPPPKVWSKDRLAVTRKKRLKKRIQSKAPMFADQLIEEEIEKNPYYYNGETDAELESARDATLQEWEKRYQRLLDEGIEERDR